MKIGNKTAGRLGMILLFSIVTLTSVAAPSWTGTTGTENGWPLVNNPMQPVEGDQTIAAVEIWRLGHEDDEQEMIFGLIGDGLVDEAENTYLLDTILSTIYKVGPDGTVLENLGQEGDGPGELRNTMNMVFMPGGNLGVHEMMPGGIAILGRDGEPRPSFSFGEANSGAMHHITRMDSDKSGLVLGKSSTEFGSDQTVTTAHSLARYAADGTVLFTLFQKNEKQSGGRITLGGDGNDFTRYWSLGPNGQVVVFQENQEYKLEVFDSSGNPGMIIRREYKPVRRSDKEIEQDEREQEEMKQRFGGMDFPPVAQMARHITDAFARPNGDLWVQNSQGDHDCPENSIGYFDVFNPDGHYVKRIRIEADYDPLRDNFQLLGNHLLVFKEAQKAPDRTMSSGGGNMMMIMTSGSSSDDEDDDEEPRPYEVVFYRLP